MPLFQSSVVDKYLKSIDKEVLNAAYAKFRMHFHNPVIMENIKNSKEEQYQGEFSYPPTGKSIKWRMSFIRCGSPI